MSQVGAHKPEMAEKLVSQMDPRVKKPLPFDNQGGRRPVTVVPNPCSSLWAGTAALTELPHPQLLPAFTKTQERLRSCRDITSKDSRHHFLFLWWPAIGQAVAYSESCFLLDCGMFHSFSVSSE